jgi:Cysteine-rich CPCC
MNTTPDYPCPCCGFETFSEPPGSYEICDICGWEDDHVQLAHPLIGGGANRMSLQEAQIRQLKVYPVDIQNAGGHKRAPDWRPLQQSDFQDKVAPDTGIQYFHAAAEDAVDYYWKR